MLLDVGADNSLPALEMENFPVPALQPVADADRDADQRSPDEIMETRRTRCHQAMTSSMALRAHALPPARRRQLVRLAS